MFQPSRKIMENNLRIYWSPVKFLRQKALKLKEKKYLETENIA